MSEVKFFWATVESVSPVTVRRDGETEPMGVSPSALVDPMTLQEGNRVWCQLQHRRALIVGVSGGQGTGPWVNLSMFGGWSRSYGQARYNNGGIDIVAHFTKDDGSSSNAQRPARLPSSSFYPDRSAYFQVSTSHRPLVKTMYANSDGELRVFSESVDGGWLNINTHIPDFYF